MTNIYKLKELSKDLKLLYVEDEESIRSAVVGILELFFETIYIAENGKEGIEKFDAHQVDLIITDIQMPQLDGLSMIEKIREKEPNIPVVITTAFNDEAYFIKSIDLRVDKYLLKPIRQEKVIDTLLDIAQMIDDREKARAYEVKLMQERVNQITSNLISTMVDSYQSPCIIYTGKKVEYINDTFCALFEGDDLQSFLNGEVGTEKLFDQKEEFLASLELYNEEDVNNRRVSISKKHGRKIYRITKKEIALSEGKQSAIYIFNDITLEEYQKIKLQAYSERLEEIVIKSYYKKESLKQVEVQEEVSKEPNKEPKEKLTIDEEQNALLRRSHIHKTAASEYLEELDDEILAELQELDELDSDFSDAIDTFEVQTNAASLAEMSNSLHVYANKISLLFEFEDLAYAIRSLATLIVGIDVTTLDEKVPRKIGIFLSGIQSDLASWRQFIFVERSAIDIHYLDSSLFSACLQIELVLSEKVEEMESDEDDLILF